jgi:ankyrin repeat protein
MNMMKTLLLVSVLGALVLTSCAAEAQPERSSSAAMPVDPAVKPSARPSAAQDAILKAAGSGDLEKVKTLLNEDPKLVSCTNHVGFTPLHLAAANGHKDVADLLLANKADANVKAPNGVTPLFHAAFGDHKDVVELLLANKADPNAKTSYGQTPLHAAVLFGDKSVVELLLTNKADVDATDHIGHTPLHAAIAAHTEVADLLRQHGGHDWQALFPPSKQRLRGANSVRVRNPNAFAVIAGLRAGENGLDFYVPANGMNTGYVPDGKYDVYFIYSDKPDALFQGDSITLNRNRVEIQIAKVVNGNYGIHQVK